MTNSFLVRCDGCGQRATPEHLARRVQRLEWATRYRPVHIHTLLLGSASPRDDREFLYSPHGEFCGEAAILLGSMRISTTGKAPDAVHAEVQRAGLFLTHLFECPVEDGAEHGEGVKTLLAQRVAAMATRIRRSLKPKRVVLISLALQPLVTQITAKELECSVVLDEGKAFALDGPEAEKAAARLREALSAPAEDWPLGQAPTVLKNE
jgi:hypothetical protein